MPRREHPGHVGHRGGVHRLARRRVADAVGREGEQRVGVGRRRRRRSGRCPRACPRRRRPSRRCAPTRRRGRGRAGGRSPGSPACPTPPVDHPTTRYPMRSPSAPGLGRKPEAHVGDRRALDLVGARRSASGGAARPARSEPLRQRATEPARRGEHVGARARVRPTRRDALQQLGRVHLAHRALDDRRRAGVLQRRARAPSGGARRTSASRDRRARRGGRGSRVPVQCASSASRLRVAQPIHALPDRSPRSAPRELLPPLVDLPEHRAAVDGDLGEPDRRQRPAVRRRVARRPRSRAWPWGTGTSTGRGVRTRRVGARDGAAPVGLVRAGHEHLLAVEHEAGRRRASPRS